MRENSTDPFTDVEDMFTHLANAYEDPDRERKARRDYQNLRMKITDKYHDFLTEFLYLAAEARIPEDQWRDHLYDKLTRKMQEITMSAYIDDKTFREFTNYCGKVANNLESLQNKNISFSTTAKGQSAQNSRSSASTTPTPRGGTPAASNRSIMPSLSLEERRQLMSEGRCFNCKKPGYIGPNCPEKQAMQLKILEKTADKRVKEQDMKETDHSSEKEEA